MKLFSLLTILCVLNIAQAEEYSYLKASGRYWMPHEDGGNTCVLARWQSKEYNDTAGVMVYQFGSTEVRLSDQGTWSQEYYEDTNMFQCQMVSNLTYRQYKEKKKEQFSFNIGTFEFIKPFTKTLNLTQKVVPTEPSTHNTDLIWHSNEEGWVGLDRFITTESGYNTFSRFWWDTSGPDEAPDEDDFLLSQCDTNVTDNFQMPHADCRDFYDAPEATFNMRSKAMKASGSSYTWIDGQVYRKPVKLYNDPVKKLYTYISGDPSKQADPTKFTMGFWSNASGTFLMGAEKCTWHDGWTYDVEANNIGTPKLRWIGKARIEHFWPDVAKDLEVNLYLGVHASLFPIPIMSMVDTQKRYRGDMLFLETDAPPETFFVDKVEDVTPDAELHQPHESCTKTTGTGERFIPNTWYIFLFLGCSFVIKF